MKDVCDCLLCREEYDRMAEKRKRFWTACIAIALLIVAFLLSSCAPFQMAGTNSRGAYVIQSGGVGHKMKGGVLKAQHGDIILEQILEEPDGTEIVKQVSSDRLTLGLARVWSGRDKHVNDNETSVKLGEQDVQKTQIAADKEIQLGEQALEASDE